MLFERAARPTAGRLFSFPTGHKAEAILNTVLQYSGAAGAVVASLIVSLNLGRRWTGIGFVIFVCSSLALIAWGFLQKDSEGIGYQNIVLLVINAIGVYRYLLSSHDPDAGAA